MPNINTPRGWNKSNLQTTAIYCRKCGRDITTEPCSKSGEREYVCRDCWIVCADAIDFLQGLPDNSIDLVLTDPPYGHKNNDDDLIANRERALGRGLPGAPRPIANDGEEATTPPKVYQRKASQAERKAGAAATETKRQTIDHNAVEQPIEPEAEEGEFEDVPPLGANPLNPTGEDEELEAPIEGFADKRDELVYYCGEIERACGFKDGDVLFALSSFEGRDGKTIWMRDPYKPGLKESWIDMTLHKAHQVFDALKDAIDPVAAYHQALHAMKK